MNRPALCNCTSWLFVENRYWYESEVNGDQDKAILKPNFDDCLDYHEKADIHIVRLQKLQLSNDKKCTELQHNIIS